MRSFRTAAVAGVTAIALSLGTASAAFAQEEDTTSNLSSGFSALSSGGFAGVGDEWDADLPATGEDIFGEIDDRENQPAWVQNMYDLTWMGGIASLLGVVIFPAYNYLVYTGVLK
ncbi:hypothetical protein [uncultured Corynebacterium sp.]|uniref:hypothetical protein n=1 Tax=uncultured Corynebacterium sp. TaxID=159447 RepID=UPI0025D13332|nr:hypothetical protein [uncultured Corynebacterium sp.]